MKKVNLLALAALTSVGSAFAETYNIITDGVLNADYALMETTNTLETAAGPDGKNAAKLTHDAEYSHVGIDMSKAPIDMTKAYMIEMEYAITPEALEGATSLWSDKKPFFIIGASNVDIEGGAEVTVNKADAVISFDGKMVNGQESVANTYYKDVRYMYANPNVTSINVLAVSFCWEIDETYVAYIKNMKIFSPDDCAKPFYAEDFESCNGKVAVYSDNTNAGKLKAEQMHGNATLNSDELITLKRDWQEGGLADGSGYYLDDEQYHALVVAKDQKISITVALPEGIQTIYSSLLAKYQWEEETETAFYAAAQPMNAKLVFNDAAATSAQLASVDTIPNDRAKLNGQIAVPAGATSVDIVFDNSDGEFNYMIDDLQLSTCASVDVEEAVAAKASIVVTPNPATDVITVAGAEKIEVISLSGAVVASANGEQANVAALAAGAYIVKATTAEGVAFATIIKK